MLSRRSGRSAQRGVGGGGERQRGERERNGERGGRERRGREREREGGGRKSATERQTVRQCRQTESHREPDRQRLRQS